MSWLERKYISIVSSQLRNYKVKQTNPFLANFSCPYCHDSAKNKNKARGYIYTIKGNLNYKCFNCTKSFSFFVFLKDLDPNEYKKFIFEKFKGDGTLATQAAEIKEVSFKDAPKEIFLGTKLTELPSDNPGVVYLQNRKIPKEKFESLFYIENFSKLQPSFPDYDWETMPKDSRIVFPINNRQGQLVGISARAINKTKLRYVILKVRDEPMIFNLDKIDISKRVFVTEGAIDSFFLPNSIAVDGADFAKLGNIIPKDSMVIVFDDEARNKEIVNKMRQMSDLGFTLAIWPSWIRPYGKDINAMILNGMTSEKIIDTISENTYKGLKLKLALANWRK